MKNHGTIAGILGDIFINLFLINRVSQIFDCVLGLFFFPEGKVFFEKFDNRFGISESLFIDIIDLLESQLKSAFP